MAVNSELVNSEKTVVDLVGPDSWFIFEALSMDYDWLIANL